MDTAALTNMWRTPSEEGFIDNVLNCIWLELDSYFDFGED
jgi:hypothetical protein